MIFCFYRTLQLTSFLANQLMSPISAKNSHVSWQVHDAWTLGSAEQFKKQSDHHDLFHMYMRWVQERDCHSEYLYFKHIEFERQIIPSNKERYNVPDLKCPDYIYFLNKMHKTISFFLNFIYSMLSISIKITISHLLGKITVWWT